MANDKPDYYKILGVSESADDVTIKSSYYRLAKRTHPDKNPGDEAATARFQQVQHAYAIVSDPIKRRDYNLDRAKHRAAQKVAARRAREKADEQRRRQLQKAQEEQQRSWKRKQAEEARKAREAERRSAKRRQRHEDAGKTRYQEDDAFREFMNMEFPGQQILLRMLDRRKVALDRLEERGKLRGDVVSQLHFTLSMIRSSVLDTIPSVFRYMQDVYFADRKADEEKGERA